MARALSWTARGTAAACAAGIVAFYAGCGDLIVSATMGDAGPDGTTSDADFESDATALDGPATGSDDAGLDADAGRAKLDCTGQDAAFGPPNDLACTGLYADWTKRIVSADAKEFDPGLRAWNDGAASTRWIHVPHGEKIDTRDMNEWRFPVGFKSWQELRLGGRAVETRHFWKRGENDWVRTTYRWSEDGKSARALAQGASNVSGEAYAIPTAAQCDACHAGRIDKVLGFEAVSLSSPSSVFDGKSPAIDAVLPLLTAPPSALAVPDDVAGTAAPALGWMHANCGTSCHNASPGAFDRASGLRLRLEIGASGLGDVASTAAYQTSVCRAARVRPHEPSSLSLVAARGAARGAPLVQMPPFGSTVPDPVGVRLLDTWILGGSFPAQTGAGEKCP